MIRRPPRSTLDRSSAASDVYKRQRIDISCQWLMKFGAATLETQVPAGGQVTAFYAAPWHQFSRGAIGFEKQKRPGAVGFAVMMAAIVVVVVAIFLVPNL